MVLIVLGQQWSSTAQRKKIYQPVVLTILAFTLLGHCQTEGYDRSLISGSKQLISLLGSRTNVPFTDNGH